MMSTADAAAVAVLAMLLGLLLVVGGQGMRHRRGLGPGRTVALDDRTLYSRRHGLAGRPDRIVRDERELIPEEWKGAGQIRPWHRAQMAVYFIVIEEDLGVGPPYGIVVCGDGSRHKVENTEALRAWVLDVAGRIREARRKAQVPIRVHPQPGQCRPCGMRGQCGQARP